MIESKKNTLKMTAIVVAITIVSNVFVTLALQMIMMTPSYTTAFAQKIGAKLKTKNTVIKATNVANVVALCEPNNKLLSGGYTIGDLSKMISDFNDLRIYDSKPIRTQSGQEGWLISAYNPETGQILLSSCMVYIINKVKKRPRSKDNNNIVIAADEDKNQ